MPSEKIRKNQKKTDLSALDGNLYRILFETTHEGVCLAGPNGETILANAQMAAMLGCTPEELAARSVLDFAFDPDLAAVKRRWAKLWAGGEPDPIELHLRRADGLSLWALVAVSPVRDADGQTLGLLGMFTDVTARKQLEADALAAWKEAEARATEAEKGRSTLDALMEHVPIGLAIADGPDVRVRRMSRFAIGMHGLPRDGWQQLSMSEILARWEYFELDGVTPAATENLPLVRAALHGETVLDRELVTRLADGRRLSLLCHAGPIRDAAGKVTGAIVAWQDISARQRLQQQLIRTHDELERAVAERTAALERASADLHAEIAERRRAEAESMESGERFSNAFELAPIGMALIEPDGAWLRVNQAFCDLVGFSADELLGRSVQDLTHPEDLGAAAECARQLRVGESAHCQMEERYAHKGGGFVWASVSLSLVRDVQGEPQYFIAQIQDIADRRRAEEELRDNAERFRVTFDRSPVGSVVVSCDFHFVQANEAFCRFIGYSEAALLGLTFADVTHPGHREADLANVKRLLAGEIDIYRTEKRYLHKNGNVIWGDASVALVRDDDASPLYFVTTVQDITSRRTAEESLRKSEERYRMIAENATDCIWTTDLALKFTYVSPSVARMRGYTADEAAAQELAQIFPVESLTRAATTFAAEMQRDGRPGVDPHRLTTLELQEYCKDGSLIWTENLIGFLRDDAQRPVGVIGVTRDITERKRLQDQALNEERRLQAVLRVSQRKYATVKEMLDAALVEMVALTDSKLGCVFRYDQNKREFEVRAWSKDALPECSNPPCEYTRRLEDTDIGAEVVRRGEPVIENDYGARARAGAAGEAAAKPGRAAWLPERVAVVRLMAVPVFKDGQIVALAGVADKASDYLPHDAAELAAFMDSVWNIARRVEAEEINQRLETQLRQQQKLEALGILAGGVAHEINNPISGILNLAELLEGREDLDERAHDFARRIIKETHRVATIVKNLLSFARQDQERHSLVRPADIIADTVSLIAAVLRKDQIELTVDRPAGMPLVRCRAQQLQQVLMNLLTNARDALNERYPGFHDDKKIRITPAVIEKAGQRWLRLCVEDHGSGIRPETECPSLR
jgi:PAS domain S-box-containing protein